MSAEPAVALTPPWRVLLSYARPHWTALLAGGVLSLATTASGLALPLVVRELIGNLGGVGPVAPLVAAMAALVARERPPPSDMFMTDLPDRPFLAPPSLVGRSLP